VEVVMDKYEILQQHLIGETEENLDPNRLSLGQFVNTTHHDYEGVQPAKLVHNNPSRSFPQREMFKVGGHS
jgi:hypothetical protein